MGHLLGKHGVRRGPGASGETRLRGTAAEMVGPTGGRRVVVLADPARPDAVAGWLHDVAADHVTLLVVDEASDLEVPRHVSPVGVADLDDAVARLSRLGVQDVIVVVLGPEALGSLAGDQAGLFEHLFLHLRRGGAYVVDRAAAQGDPPEVGHERGDDRFFRLLAAGPDHEAQAGLHRRVRAIAQQVESVLVADDLAVATKLGHTLLKLSENHPGDLLPAREPGLAVSVLETRPAGRLDLTADHASYGPSRAEPWPATIEYPELTLRHYEGSLVSLGAMRLYTDDTILPETFRWPRTSYPSNPRIQSLSPLFARVDRHEPPDVLDGDFYFLDCVFPGHFGHLTTEVLCRLWGWERAKREAPGLRALFHVNPDGRGDGSLERRLFTAYGIAESDLTCSDRPVRLRSVVGASPMWHNHEPFYVHPDLRETWARLTSGLLAGAEPASYDRIFVSRGAALSSRRACRNQAEVEGFFADRGFHVFCPEELPLGEQAAVFAGARVVAGFAGSAMSNLMHCRRLEAVVAIGHNAYVARNEHLFASVLGAELHYFWQTADVQPPPRVKRTKASDRSSFAFDFAAYGDDLARVLAGL